MKHITTSEELIEYYKTQIKNVDDDIEMIHNLDFKRPYHARVCIDELIKKKEEILTDAQNYARKMLEKLIKPWDYHVVMVDKDIEKLYPVLFTLFETSRDREIYIELQNEEDAKQKTAQ